MENSNNKTPKKKIVTFNLYWIYAVIFFVLIALYVSNDTVNQKELNWTEFQTLAADDAFEQMTVFNRRNVVEATVRDSKIKQVFGPNANKTEKTSRVLVTIPSADKFSDFFDKAVADNKITTKVRFEEGDDTIWSFIVSFGPMLLLVGVWIFLMRRMSGGSGAGPGGVFSVGRSKAQLFDKETGPKVTFKDVAGLAGAKEEVEEIVQHRVDFVGSLLPHHHLRRNLKGRLAGKVEVAAALHFPALGL